VTPPPVNAGKCQMHSQALCTLHRMHPLLHTVTRSRHTHLQRWKQVPSSPKYKACQACREAAPVLQAVSARVASSRIAR
jgi:hypothetical protein